MIYIVTEMAFKKFWYRYYCFSLFKSGNINRTLMWILLPFSLIAYYYQLSQSSVDYQWYIYFTSKEFYILLLSLIIWNNYRHTRDAAIATAVLIKSLYDTFSQLLGLSDKYAAVGVTWHVLIYGLIIHSIYRYYVNARKN